MSDKDELLEELVTIRVNVACIAQLVAKLAQEVSVLNPSLDLSEGIEDMIKIIRKTYDN